MASETVNGLTIEVRIYGSVVASDGRRQDVNISKRYDFADGTGTNQIGAINYDEARTLNTTTETLDLDALVDFKGAVQTDNNNVKFAFFENNSSTTGQILTVGGGDFTGWFGDASDKLKVGPSGIALIVSPVDGYAITASTGDGLQMETNANMTYDVLLGLDNA